MDEQAPEIKVDLTLVPVDELIYEIGNRVDILVIGYIRTVDPGDPIYHVDAKNKLGCITSIGLCDMIKRRIIANLDAMNEDVGPDVECGT